MYKYDMMINGESYKALFLDHIEAADFLDDNIQDGSEVVILEVTEVTPMEALADEDFEESYKVEKAAADVLPNFSLLCHSVDQLINALWFMGLEW